MISQLKALQKDIIILVLWIVRKMALELTVLSGVIKGAEAAWRLYDLGFSKVKQACMAIPSATVYSVKLTPWASDTVR